MIGRWPAAVALMLFALPVCAEEFGPTAAQWRQTAAWTEACQNPDGGYGPAPNQPSTLGATSSALKVLRATGGAVRDIIACHDFVLSCHDRATGGFAPTPGGQPTVPVTAQGLMALGETRFPAPEQIDAALGYLDQNAKTFEEIRIAVAGLEAVGKPAIDSARWLGVIDQVGKRPDGTFGAGEADPYLTGSATAAQLRLKVQPTAEVRDAALKVILAGQRPDGGWGEAGKASSLGASYRIMRAVWMLDAARPDLDKLRAYVQAHRNPDGTYRPAPDAPTTDAGGTYLAVMLVHWVKLLSGEPAFIETIGFRPLINGDSLDADWEGDPKHWSIKDGMLVGSSLPDGLQHNVFLSTKADYADFTLRFEFRLIGGADANSGMQFRSERLPPHEMKGYQADIGAGFWGCLYDESRRNRVLAPASERATTSVRVGGWNAYDIRVLGPEITLSLNGNQSLRYVEDQPDIPRTGKLGAQVHGGGPMTITYRDLRVQVSPSPQPDDTFSTKPGFRVWEVESGGARRKFTVHFPNPGPEFPPGPYPVVLFLHGSGERGNDGVKPAQVGIGPALLAAESAFPFVTVIPQAVTSWDADGPDAVAALAAVDLVLSKSGGAEGRKVIVTGLSMGGAGAWNLAAKHPERFAACAPICGRGRVEVANALKDVPVWAFCGDQDRAETVAFMRAVVRAIRGNGGKAQYTEYKGVGHNSWDRAYADPEFVAWMRRVAQN